MKVENEIKQKIYEKYIAEGEAEIAAYEGKQAAIVAKQQEIDELVAEVAGLKAEVDGIDITETCETVKALRDMLAELTEEKEQVATEEVAVEEAVDTGLVVEQKQDEIEQEKVQAAPTSINGAVAI